MKTILKLKSLAASLIESFPSEIPTGQSRNELGAILYLLNGKSPSSFRDWPVLVHCYYLK